MGCGRVGSSLARSLEKRGHTVAVIDIEPESFRRLGPDFAGKTVKGVGFDREVLLEAGIEDADGFAAVSSGDNSNILSARVVRETFGVDNVVARIYDPGLEQYLAIKADTPHGLARKVGAESAEGLRVQVDHRDGVAALLQALGQAGPDPAAAHDHDVHAVESSEQAREDSMTPVTSDRS